MKEELPESTKRLRKIGLGIFVVLSLLSGFMIWQVDLFHLHFGYRDAKEEYLNSGMPWTSEDLYKDLTPDQVEKRSALVKAANLALKEFKLDYEHRYDQVSKANALKRLQQISRISPHLDKMVALSDSPLHGLIDVNEGFNASSVPLGEMKRAVALLALRGQWKVTAGQFADGRKDLESAYSLAKNFGKSETFIGYFMGHSSFSSVDASVIKAASALKGNQAKLASLEKLLVESHSWDLSPKTALRGEALIHIAYARNADVLREVSTAIFQDALPGAVTRQRIDSGDPRSIGRRSVAVPFLELWAEVGESMKNAPDDQNKWFDALRKGSSKAMKRGGMTASLVHFFTIHPDLILDALKRHNTLRLVNLSLLRGTRMNLEGRSQGEIEAAMETDPYSGQPLVWKSTGSTFTVWSVGPNGADDGGISRADYRKLMGSGSTKVGGVEPYDVPATLPWRPEPKPNSTGAPFSHLKEEDR